ncbi:peptidoglycan DD-metalloendopeptidase family protein [Mycetohabitans sp. B46]|uniref:peptidoglycan DD-metalloendopeptidase family protein n=1 Tax=Mycetohabitans sp. B46 TaxID=2772536 RepID=UPI00307E17E8
MFKRVRALGSVQCVTVCCGIALLLSACGSVPVGSGFYRVARGDTLSRIAQRNGQSVAAIARWNNLSNPDMIEVGRILRVAPPTRPAPPAGTTPSRGAAVAPNTTAKVRPSLAPATTISLIWPARGNVVRRFNGVDSKGVDIANALGTPVVAAATGTVVYAGHGLRGYGNLLIIKHNANFLTAYAHNHALLVKEGQKVTQGQTIAEMGDSDSNRVALHFELRYNGKSIDPARYLPPQ